MILYTQIKGEELTSDEVHKSKTFSIGSQFEWGSLIWEITESTDKCQGCYFHGINQCFCTKQWFEKLGECTALARADNKDVVFKLYKTRR